MAEIVKTALDKTGITRIVAGSPEDSDDSTILTRAFAAAVYPFQLAITPTAIKAYLTVILFSAASIGLLALSTTAYTFFYYQYIPQTSLERPVYFQYVTGQPPTAYIPLRTHALISEQPYDVSVTLHMPRTPSNLAAGNFMLDMTLHNSDYSHNSASVLVDPKSKEGDLRRSSRPAILPYSSRLTQLAHTLSHLPFHIFSLHDLDSTTLHIPMFEDLEFKRGRQNIPTHIELELRSQPAAAFIQSPTNPTPQLPLQVYSAKVSFQVRFHGFRYWIYNYRVLAFVVFTSLFYAVSISSLAIAWASLATILHVRQQKHPDPNLALEPAPKQRIKPEPQPQQLDTSDTKIKSEVDESRLLMSELPLSSQLDDNHIDRSALRDQQPKTSAPGVPTLDSATDEHADDEDEHTLESEDEWEQLRRIQARIARERFQQQQQRQREKDEEGDGPRDSGIGTSMESDITARGEGSGLTRRRSEREKRRDELI